MPNGILLLCLAVVGLWHNGGGCGVQVQPDSIFKEGLRKHHDSLVRISCCSQEPAFTMFVDRSGQRFEGVRYRNSAYPMFRVVGVCSVSSPSLH